MSVAGRAWERLGRVGQLKQTLQNKDASIGPPLSAPETGPGERVLGVVLTTLIVLLRYFLSAFDAACSGWQR